MEKVSRKKKPVYPGFSFALVTGQKPNKKPALRRVIWMLPDYLKHVFGGRMTTTLRLMFIVAQRS